MLRPTIIGIDSDPLKDDVVTFAVAPIDVLSGRIVTRNITASVTVSDETDDSNSIRLPDKPLRNASGLLVFINLPEHPKYQIHVKAQAAGYFDPESTEFISPGDDADLTQRLQLDLPLFPRPDFAYSEAITLLSGVLLSANQTVQGARVSVIVPADESVGMQSSAQTFETRSDERGAFTVGLRLGPLLKNDDTQSLDQSNNSVQVNFSVATRNNNNQWQTRLELENLTLIERRRRVFSQPLDLDNSDNPVLLTV